MNSEPNAESAAAKEQLKKIALRHDGKARLSMEEAREISKLVSKVEPGPLTGKGFTKLAIARKLSTLYDKLSVRAKKR
jgi:hypothetical protein